VCFKHVSEDGDGGFPGKVEARVYYSVEKAEEGEEGVRLEWEYEVQLVGEEVEETVVNVTNHGYVKLDLFNNLREKRTLLPTIKHIKNNPKLINKSLVSGT